jgi:hypothetical protein
LFAAKSPTFDSRCVRRLVFCVCFLCVGEWLLRPGWLGRGRPAKQLGHCAAREGAGASAPPRQRRSLAPQRCRGRHVHHHVKLSHTRIPCLPRLACPPNYGALAADPHARPEAVYEQCGGAGCATATHQDLAQGKAGGQRLGQAARETAKANALSVQDQTPGLHCAATCLSHTWHRASAALPFASRSARRASKQALLAPCVLAGWLCSGQELRRCLLDHDERLLHNPAPAENASCLSFSCVCVRVCPEPVLADGFGEKWHRKKRDAFSAVTTSQACPP